jgi:dihydropteroate synthase-like protein
MVSCIRAAAKAPLSIDSTDAKEILSAADAKIDLVMSIDHANLSVLDSLDVPAVVIPRDAKGRVPHKPLERIKLVEEIITNAPGKKLIADMILSPLNSGYADSLKAYSLFRERNHLVPMLLGAGNVTELLDADSVGVNALLAGYASETGIELLFTVEASPKTRGSVRELSRAAEMFYLAKKRGQPPKDLGLDLLRLKDKRKGSVEDLSSLILPEVAARKTENRPLEDAGFRVYLDDRINAIYYYRGKPTLKITGSSAKEVYDVILDRPLTKDPFHAAYLGKELCKAEIALRLGKEYVQDRDLF